VILDNPSERDQFEIAIVEDLSRYRLFIEEYPACAAEWLYVAFMSRDFLNDDGGQAAFPALIGQWTFHVAFLPATIAESDRTSTGAAI
jgi:hypothetical protein